MKFNSLIPELKVTDFTKSLEFYVNMLGFKIEYKRHKPKFAFLSFQGSQIMLEEINDNWKTGKLEYPFGRGIHLQIKIKDIKSLLKSLNLHKYPMFIELHEKWYRKNKLLLGNRQFLIKDPDGYLLRFFEDLGIKSTKIVKRLK